MLYNRCKDSKICLLFNNHLYEEAISRMDIRYSCNQRDFKRYTTEETRNEMLITGLYKADEMVAVYSHVDRMVTLGCMPVHEEVSIDKGIDVWANFGTHYFLERREIGIFNIGDGAGTVTADGKEYHLNYKDCLYLTKGNQKVTFKSDDPEHPAKFYMVSAPAHCSYENKLITIEQAAKRPLGSVETCNKRTINQFIHPSVLKTCQLSMARTMAPNSAGSQFFIMVADAPHLDGQYAAFGKITDNAQAAVDISRVNRDMFTDKPKKPQTIKSIRVDTQGVEYPAPEKH